MNYDFSGWATRNDLKCSDGRIIRSGAFKDCDGKQVPLVWQHQHNGVENVLGHAILENRPEGVYTYAVFNNTESGKMAKEAVQNGDIKQLSIYANKLKQNGSNVMHGVIREVSLVLAGANPGAMIDTVIAHSDDGSEEAVIYTDTDIELYHAATKKDEDTDETDPEVVEDNQNGSVDERTQNMDPQNAQAPQGQAPVQGNKTIQDVIDEMTDEQKDVLYYLVGMAAQQGEATGEEDVEDEDMKHNLFDAEGDYLAHSAEDMEEVLRDAKRYGSLKESALQHGMEDITLGDALQHSITNVGFLFPDAKTMGAEPEFISRKMDWVEDVMNGVSRTPFSRVKSVLANITEDEARAKGYITGKQKKEEVFKLLKRTTDPQTIYKKQKMDRDNMVDITSFDVVAWLKKEMRMMLDEELAGAILCGDGREAADDDHISHDHIRPIWQDDKIYTTNVSVAIPEAEKDDENKFYTKLIKAIIKARKNYRGSGNPVFYTTEDVLTGMLLITDSTGRDIYESPEKLAQKLRVSKIVTVPVMEGKTRTGTDSKKYALQGIIVNLKDYNVGADNGGAVTLFDDFDIDYNAQKYLIETRCSGALVKPYAAISVETVEA